MIAAQRIGIDESGIADFFGPLVIGACEVSPETELALIGVRDAKRLRDDRCLELDELVRSTCPHAVVSIGPSKYNELYAKVNSLSTLLAWGRVRALEELLNKVECKLVVGQSIPKPETLERHFAKHGRELSIRTGVAAADDIAVAAASILARAECIRRLGLLGGTLGVRLPKGANWTAVDVGAEIVRKSGGKTLARIAKLHFKTTREVIAKAG